MKKILFYLLFFLFLSACTSTQVVSLQQITEIEKRIENTELNVSDNKIKIDDLYKNNDLSVSEKIILEKIADLEAELHNLKKDIEFDNVENSSKKVRTQEVFATQNDIIRTKPVKKKIKTVQEQYDVAREGYVSGRTDFAAAAFSKIVTRYPSHTLAANAQYWLGETYYDKKKYLMAIEEFQKVVDFYHDSTKAPDAQFKIGLSYNKIGKAKQAIIELKRIEKDYPEYLRLDAVKKVLRELN